jgi:hypothetical protein
MLRLLLCIVWKEAGLAFFKILSCIVLEELKKIMKHESG